MFPLFSSIEAIWQNPRNRRISSPNFQCWSPWYHKSNSHFPPLPNLHHILRRFWSCLGLPRCHNTANSLMPSPLCQHTILQSPHLCRSENNDNWAGWFLHCNFHKPSELCQQLFSSLHQEKVALDLEWTPLIIVTLCFPTFFFAIRSLLSDLDMLSIAVCRMPRYTNNNPDKTASNENRAIFFICWIGCEVLLYRQVFVDTTN